MALIGVCVSRKPKLQQTYLQVSSPHFDATLSMKTIILFNPSKDHYTLYGLCNNTNEPPTSIKVKLYMVYEIETMFNTISY